MAKAKSSAAPGLFSAQDYSDLRAARLKLANLVQKMDKARACGADCSAFDDARKSLDDQLAAIELHFMTPAPTN